MSDVTTDAMMHSVAAGITVDIAEEGFDRVSALSPFFFATSKYTVPAGRRGDVYIWLEKRLLRL